MSARDRLVVALVAVVAVVVIGWLEFVSPERGKVSTAQTKVVAARSALEQARSELSQAKAAQARYSEAYAAIVAMGKAVPASEEIPALIYELEKASNDHRVQLLSVTLSGNSGGSPAGAPAAAHGGQGQGGGFVAMPITFNFTGNFSDLYHLLSSLQGLDSYREGVVAINGRLLTISALNLSPSTEGTAKNKASAGELTGTITATAYVLPAGQTVTAGANPTTPPAAGGGGSGSGSAGAAVPATIKGVP